MDQRKQTLDRLDAEEKDAWAEFFDACDTKVASSWEDRGGVPWARLQATLARIKRERQRSAV